MQCSSRTPLKRSSLCQLTSTRFAPTLVVTCGRAPWSKRLNSAMRGKRKYTNSITTLRNPSTNSSSTFELGYHYPETSPHLTQEDRQEEVYTAVMNLYSPSATAAEAAAAAAKAKAAEEPRATEEGVEESSVEEPSFAEATEEATGIEEPSFTRATEEAIGENAVEEPSFARATEEAMGERAVEAALEHVDDSGPPSPLLTSLFPLIASLFPILGPLLYFIMFPPGTLTRETYDTTLPTAPAPPESLPSMYIKHPSAHVPRLTTAHSRGRSPERVEGILRDQEIHCGQQLHSLLFPR